MDFKKNMQSIRPATLVWMIVLTFAMAMAGASATAQQNETVSLSGKWQFAMAPNDTAADALSGFYKVDYKPEGFVPTPVPSNWALQGFEAPHYKPFYGDASQGFYLDHFVIPKGLTGKRILLRFGGVWSSAEIWLNGKPLGRHDSGFTEFSYDVSSLVKTDGDNLLAVRVRQVQHDYLFDTNDDWSLGGIYRDVVLVAMPKERWIDRVDVQTTFDSQYRDADLKVRVMVGDNHKKLVPGNIPNGPGEPYGLRITLKDQAGHEIQSQELSLHAHYGTGRESVVTIHALSPLQWTAETPNLYSIQVTLLEAGKPAHEVDRAVGFRQISTSGGVFRVNGQAVKLRGVDHHDEYPDVGRATTPANWLEDLKLMKAANINFIRDSHYPPAEGFLDLCDKMGMYVEDEVPMGFGGDNAADPSYGPTVMVRSYETVERDINHPSIVMWSIGNEDPLTTLHMASIHTVKGLDPTRPVLMPWRSEEWLPEEIDILAPHYLTAQENDELSAHSSRPVMASEYTHAYGTEGFGGLAERWRSLTRHPAGAGGAIWMWADQGLKVTTKKADGTIESSLLEVDDGIDGIVGSYRVPQRDYWETKAVYAQAYPAIDRIAFTQGQASVRIPIQNDFDFTDLNAIKIHWAILQDDKPLANGSATVDGKAHSTGVLDLPLTGIKEIQPGATYYAWISFIRPDGSELTKRTVELISNTESRRDPDGTPLQKPSVRQGHTVLVQTGDTSYEFDPTTGQLIAASLRGEKQLSDLRPTIWHALRSSEASSAKRDTGLKTSPDLNRYTSKVLDWHVTETGAVVQIDAKVDYTVDDKDRFSAQYRYTIDQAGRLSVHYAFVPKVQVHWIPQAGMAAELAAPLKHLRWLGLGPLDAYPNEQSAPILGVYSGEMGSDGVLGTKATRWIDVSDASGGVRFENHGYMRTEEKRPQHIEVLSAVVGRWSKGHRPEDLEQQMLTDAGQEFVGEMTISLHK